MELQEINDFIVKKVPVPPLPKIENIMGGRMFPNLYLNCYICASKKKGKSVCLSSIILNSINKKTSVIFIVPTCNKDFTYQHIFDKLEKRDINYTVYQDMEENGVDIIDALIDGLLIDEPNPASGVTHGSKKKPQQENPPPLFNLFGDEEETEFRPEGEAQVREKVVKKKAPKYLIIIDDCSQSTRSPSIARLLKVHRHLKASVFISSQNETDIVPASWRQLDYLLIFGGYSSNLPKLENIHTNMDIPVPFDTFVDIYRDATKEPFNFLWVSKDGSFRKNFNKQYRL